jgi:hypothetical protein
MGESPTLQNILLFIPPVEVATAKLPDLSKATAPTVPRSLFVIRVFQTFSGSFEISLFFWCAE